MCEVLLCGHISVAVIHDEVIGLVYRLRNDLVNFGWRENGQRIDDRRVGEEESAHSADPENGLLSLRVEISEEGVFKLPELFISELSLASFMVLYVLFELLELLVRIEKGEGVGELGKVLKPIHVGVSIVG